MLACFARPRSNRSLGVSSVESDIYIFVYPSVYLSS
jgi:hypothetical protein